MKKLFFKTTLGLAVALASSQLLASGLAINEQSISGMGTGFAGRSSSADDASTVYGNPAGTARLKQEQVSAGAALLVAKPISAIRAVPLAARKMAIWCR